MAIAEIAERMGWVHALLDELGLVKYYDVEAGYVVRMPKASCRRKANLWARKR